MRLWSIHPRYLDPKGLVAAWREALLAQKVLLGATQGYQHHPQLVRFKDSADPRAGIAFYLRVLQEEAARRGYSFDPSRIVSAQPLTSRIPVSRGQLKYEQALLLRKLQERKQLVFAQRLARIQHPRAHPLFVPTAGTVASWERRQLA